MKTEPGEQVSPKYINNFTTNQSRRGCKKSKISKDEEKKVESSACSEGSISEAFSTVSMSGPYTTESMKPKVLAPYITMNGYPPRMVEIARRKREYNEQDIEKLLLERGCDFRTMLLDGNKIETNLEIAQFDDLEYETYLTPIQWLSKGLDQNGEQHGLPAKGLYKKYGSMVWKPCSVTGFNFEKNKYDVTWHDNGNKGSLYRLETLFQAENPALFADRVCVAIRARAEAQQILRYNLYIDSMPIDDLTSLHPEQSARILSLSLSTKALQNAVENNIDTTPLLAGVSLDFCRVMNRIIWDKHSSVVAVQPALRLPEPSAKKNVKKSGLIELTLALQNVESNPKKQRGFMDTFENFSFRTLFTERRLMQTIELVRNECNKLKKKRIIKMSKNMQTSRLSDFIDSQKSHLKNFVTWFDREWIDNVCTHILTSLKDVDKGWFKLNETNTSIYNMSKLKNFFQLVNFIIEAALRHIIMQSIAEFTEMVLNAGPPLTEADTAEGIKAARDAAKKAARKKKKMKQEGQANEDVASDNQEEGRPKEVSHAPPLFVVDLCFKGGNSENVGDDMPNDENSAQKEQKIFYKASPEDCTTALKNVILQAMEALKNIKQVERRVMNKLFWSVDPVIRVPNINEDFSQDALAKVSDYIERCYLPMNEYLRQYSKYMKFIELDVDIHVDKLLKKHSNEDGKLDEDGLLLLVDEMKKMVVMHRKKVKELDKQIPPKATSNIFLINCSELREQLIEKHKHLSVLLLDLLAVKNIDATKQLLGEFQIMSKNLQLEVDDIESLTERRDYIAEVLGKMDEMVKRSEKVQSKYKILDEFQFQLKRDNFEDKWNLYGFPKRIQDDIADLQVALNDKLLEYSDEMAAEQKVFDAKLKSLRNEVSQLKRFTDVSKVEMVQGHIANIKQKIKTSKEEGILFNSREGLFNKDITDYPEIAAIQKNFLPYSNLWDTVLGWKENENSWKNEHFEKLDAEDLEKKMMEYNRKLIKSRKYFAQNGISECEKIVSSVFDNISKFKPFVPSILAMRNPGMRPRHWKKINETLGTSLDPTSDDFTLQYMIDQKVPDHEEVLTKIGESAGKEFQLEKALTGMKTEWDAIDLVIEPYRDTGTYIFKEADVIMAILDEQITMTQAMCFSSFKGPFEEEIDEWEKTLNNISEVVEEWLAVQRNWLYLQPIFDSDDIKKQLPVESKRFFTVDKNWRKVMLQAIKRSKAVEFCDNPQLCEKFQESNKFLDLVMKGLSDYLETKRAGFSRFYFLANDELLEILSETKDPTLVQPHLKKCFEAIKEVHFDPEDNGITSMKSREKEEVQFVEKVQTAGVNVEDWMNDVETGMCLAIRARMWESIIDYTKISRTEWMQKWPGQCVLNGSQVHWTSELEEFFDTEGFEGLKKYYQIQLNQLEDMVRLVRNPNLSKLGRTSTGALAVIDVHAKDVSKKMVENGVCSKNDFAWLTQLRYYWTDGDWKNGTPEGVAGDLGAIMVTSKRPYSYEYLGNSFRLVITPLTDKCYITLMSAIENILGGAPAGPAGTGKTETVKDMAKGLAKQCVVFNCSDGMDFKMTAKFFKGLASCGAWCCFDEFNRILIEVLSVIAQQIMTLQGGVRAGQTRIMFDETDIKLNWQFAVFITMNPGYAGRTALPDNLAALFRPIAMMVPDYALIGEIMLFAYGFSKARSNAQKMVATFRLCSEQLSSQDHYDYGMRAVKTVIVAAGNLKGEEPDEDEEVLMLRGLIDVNEPKFLSHDLPLFQGIMSDLFPGKKKPEIDYGALLACIKTVCKKKNLQQHPWFIDKVIQLYEMIVVRHGLMVVGPTGGGKSSNIYVLQDALTMLKEYNVTGKRFETVWVKYINPKSITMGQLYGSFDPNTHEWRDGVLANMIRVCVQQADSSLKWVLFDGPVDTLWIESMNTVLDDNKKLCLNSGEMVALSPEMTMMFEPADLAVASPATVSRCGMIYMQPHSLGLDPAIDSWFSILPRAFSAEFKKKLREKFDIYLHGSLNFLRRHIKEAVPSVNNNLAGSLMRFLDCFFAKYRYKDGQDPPTSEVMDKLMGHLDPIFMFTFVWSVAGTSDYNGRLKWDGYLRSLVNSAGTSSPFPKDGIVYDFYWEEETSSWQKWMKLANPYVHDTRLSFSEITVATTDSTRYTWILDTLITNGKHVLMCGPTGTGKTVNINKHLQTGMTKEYIPLCFTFSAQTSANQTQDIIDSKCDKRRKGVYGPMAGKKYIIFVDDVNMPQREIFFAQPPIELLRQWLCSSGWYDRKTLKWKTIIDSQLVIACGPPGGGRNPVTPRFFRHFNYVSYTAMEDDVMYTIFNSILENFLIMGKFDESLAPLANSIVWSSIEVYNQTLNELLPTPDKPHYTFNLRDLGKIFQGMLMANKTKLTEPLQIVRMWVHETLRVFGDRLTNPKDRTWFSDRLREKVETRMKTSWSDCMTNDVLLFGDYMIPGADPKVYCEVTQTDQIQPIFEEYLADYNAETKTPMNLVLFSDAIQHVSRISRVLRQPQGNALLFGVGGSGRQSLTRLATSMAEYELYQVEIAKGYGQAEWREDLRQCLLKAGVEDTPVVFLFVDTQIVFEGMLEDINNILNSGDVPNLYGPEEMDQIVTTCRAECTKKRLPPTKINIYAQYIIRVRRNIHMVIAMSPIGDDFRRRLRMFPSLVNCCTIDWFSEWPDEALLSVARNAMTIEDMMLGESIDGVVEFFKTIHQTAAEVSKDFLSELGRYNYVTPTSYLELLDTYKKIIKKKRVEVGDMKFKLQNGLDTMASTEEEVGKLQAHIIEMKPVLLKTSQEVADMIESITKDKADAAIVKSAVEKSEAEAKIQGAEAKAIADDAQRDLDEALPALDEAVKCLSLLKKSDLDEVRSLKTPPSGVKLTMEVACVIFGVKPVREKDPNNLGKKINNYWISAKAKLLNNPKKLLEMLIEYDKDNMEEAVVEKVKVYYENPDFLPKQIEKASKACTAICMWARAMYKYSCVAKEVEPKKKLLAEAQASLEVTMGVLKEAQTKLAAVMAKLAKLEKELAAAVAQKEDLEAQMKLAVERLERADVLISGLGGEKARWKITVVKLTSAFENLIGDVLVAACTISYLGCFTPAFRSRIVKLLLSKLEDLKIVPFSEGASIRSVLEDPVLVRHWIITGLPTDTHSVENAIVMSYARRWPLFIDPQQQANRFIKNLGKTEAKNGIDLIKLTDANFLRTLENGVRFGKWVLLENILETLDASLEPLLQQQKFKQGGSLMIKIGDSTIPYNDNFKFFMTTKLPNPHYPPEVCVKVTLLNFTITPTGLEDQLLGVVVVKEKPELEEQKNALLVANARMQKQLKEIEDSILKLLAESTGNILDDVELIQALADSKKVSREIEDKVKEAAETELVINAAREGYRSVAFRGSLLYFCIADLALVDPMYQYSLQWFVSLFTKGIEEAEKNEDLEIRKQTLIDYFTLKLYINVCRSLFENHKLIFSFLKCIAILRGYGKIDPLEFKFLTLSQAEAFKEAPNPAPEWLVARAWTDICTLSSLPAFEGFEIDFATNITHWRGYFDSLTPQTEKFPEAWEAKLNSMQKMCVLKCLRPDKCADAIMNYVIENMSQEFVEPPPFDLSKTFADSSCTTPLVFVLTAGSDPTKMFNQFAEDMEMGKKTKGISLGQGQDVIAEQMIRDGIEKGTWVYLQNCHLYVSWMNTLEQMCENIDPENCHRNFRLWLTSMPSKAFPVAILQNGIKMTIEPPKGLKANLKNAYFKLDDTKLEKTEKPKEYKKLLWALSFFHAIVQDRRKYGGLGWNIPYEFNDTDLAISKTQLEMFLDTYDETPYKQLIFLISYINYGGRVTDYIDLRTIDVLLRDLYVPEIMTDTYKFSSSGLYYSIPVDPETPHKKYMEFIDKMPLNSAPEAFGMHENAAIICAETETSAIFEIVVKLQAKSGSGAGKTYEEILDEAAGKILETVPKPFKIDEVAMMYPLTYSESMNTVLIQELMRYNNIIIVIRKELPTMRKALKGLVVMSVELEATANAIFTQQIPPSWDAVAYPSLKALSAWSDELVERLEFLQKWIDEGIPPSFWVPGFFFPQAFFTGTQQNFARKYQLPIDTLTFDYIMLKEEGSSITEKPEDGCYIYGLYLEGARWNSDKMTLDDSKPKQLYTHAPAMHLLPVKDRERPTTGIYRCPVYKELRRAGTLSTTGHSTNFIMWLEIPGGRSDIRNNLELPDQDYWIKAGVAMFCALRY